VAVRVFHGDDSRAYRFLISEVLAGDGVEVVGSAGTPDAVVAGVATQQPDVVLLDQLGGGELLDRVRAVAPGVRIIVLSGFEPGSGDPEVGARADGYLVKSADLGAIRRAVLDA
jgi:DNA-binding NarL/FixJ family response regulator